MIPSWLNIYFQDSNSLQMEHLIFFNDHSMAILNLILFWFMIFILNLNLNKFFSRFFNENQEIEYFWTTLPSVMLIFLAMPSMKILYMSEDYSNYYLSFKVIGHQWYWTYECEDLLNEKFDSFMEESKLMRILDSSSYLNLPVKINSRILVSSEDVIHSWAIPSMAVKVDAIPGRINQISINPNRIGLFVGQCSEICGVNHSFMPIGIMVYKL